MIGYWYRATASQRNGDDKRPAAHQSSAIITAPHGTLHTGYIFVNDDDARGLVSATATGDCDGGDRYVGYERGYQEGYDAADLGAHDETVEEPAPGGLTYH